MRVAILYARNIAAIHIANNAMARGVGGGIKIPGFLFIQSILAISKVLSSCKIITQACG
jgi:hypothetical protein